jgi:hypothetical protein
MFVFVFKFQKQNRKEFVICSSQTVDLELVSNKFLGYNFR